MANAVYPEYKEFLLSASANVSLNVDDTTDGPFVALVDTGTYTYSSAHDFYSDLSGIVGTDQRIASPTVANGTFDGADVTFTAVSGSTVEALVIYRHNSGANTTWKLVLYQDSSVTGLPVTPNGGDIVVTWNASGIFTISDRRLKENIREIGDLFGKLPVYSYNYNGQDVPRVGLMAQDVEKMVPHAVIEFARDRKAVDYSRVIEALA
jgi:hypothetical protein